MVRPRPRDAQEWLHAFWRRKLLIGAVVALIAAPAAVYISRMPDVYESQAVFLLTPRPKVTEVAPLEAASAAEHLESRANLEPIILAHDLYPTARAVAGMDAAVAAMRSAVSVDVRQRGEQPTSIAVGFRHDDPATAQRVAADLVKTFERLNGEASEKVASEASAIRAELAEIDRRMAELGHRRGAAAAQERAADRQLEISDRIRAQREAANQTVATLLERRTVLEHQIQEQERQIAAQREVVQKAATPSQGETGPAFRALQERRAEVEGRLRGYEAQYTDKNPKVIQARAELAQLDGELAALKRQATAEGPAPTSPVAAELRSLERELARLHGELVATTAELSRRKGTGGPVGVPAVGAVSTGGAAVAAEAEAEIEKLNNRYSALLEREHQLQESGLLGPGAGLFAMVDAPHLPQVPAGPQRARLLAAAAAGALMLALALAWLLEMRRASQIEDARDVDYYLGVPVLALIPEASAGAYDRARALPPARAAAASTALAVIASAGLGAKLIARVAEMLAGR